MTRKKIRLELDRLAARVEAAWKEHEKDPDHGNHPFICPGVGVVGTCTDSAVHLAELLGGDVLGYSIDENPTAELGVNEFGHDFAVVDGRWLVDFWAKDTYQLPDLYDMNDPVEATEVRRLYGDPGKWDKMSAENLARYNLHLKRT